MADPSSPDDPHRSGLENADTRGARELDDRLQIDPELREGRVSGGKMAAYAVGIAILLAALFYGLNRTHTENAGTKPPTETSQTQPATPGASPRPNTAPGTTTGSATTRPPQSETAAGDSDRAAKPADNNGAPPRAQDNDQR
ncbi:MAG: hypothetical protein JO128_21495 [Alphaproteobacteria bacterium]|nr:hypothetical protein [Alphaproteobacteria bacterium]